MPVNKNAYARYRIIDDILSYKKYADLPTLREACERRLDDDISERTLKEDIRVMRETFDAPIEFDKAYKGYYYSQAFSMQTTVPLRSRDLSALQFAAGLLSQFSQIPVLAEFKDTVDKIEKVIKIKQQSESADFIRFEQTPYFKGSELLSLFARAIGEERILNFSYQAFDTQKSSKQYVLHPYLLKEYRNRWYVIGYQPDRAQIRTFGLDRISEPIISEQLFTKTGNFDPDIYFKHSIGITVLDNQEPQDIVLMFDEQQGKYLEAQPIHESQTTEESQEGLLVRLHLLITYELVSVLLSYGERVKVIAPQSLKELIYERLKKSLENYPAPS